MREIKDIKVGLITCGNGVGDTIISIKALYIAKALYGAKCVLFGEKISHTFVRMINPKIYDESISSLDFAPTAFATTQAHKSRIAEFLHKQKLGKHLILLNPFSVSGLYSLSKNAFLDIAERIEAKFSDCTCIIATYPKVHSEFMHFCDKYQKKLKNLLIFPNDDDIFNLIELCKRVSCVITPSTGVAHIAANVGTPTVALCGKQDMNRWILGGGGGVAHSYTKARYVLLEQNLSYLIAHPSEEAHYIDKVVESLKEVLQSES